MYDYHKFLDYWKLHLNVNDAPLDIIDKFNRLGSKHTVKACILGGLMTSEIGNLAASHNKHISFDVLTLNAAISSNALVIWLDNMDASIESCINGSISFIAMSGLADVPTMQSAMKEYSSESAAIMAKYIKIVKDNPPTWDQ